MHYLGQKTGLFDEIGMTRSETNSVINACLIDQAESLKDRLADRDRHGRRIPIGRTPLECWTPHAALPAPLIVGLKAETASGTVSSVARSCARAAFNSILSRYADDRLLKRFGVGRRAKGHEHQRRRSKFGSVPIDLPVYTHGSARQTVPYRLGRAEQSSQSEAISLARRARGRLGTVKKATSHPNQRVAVAA
jgi:hypothetical protein